MSEQKIDVFVRRIKPNTGYGNLEARTFLRKMYKGIESARLDNTFDDFRTYDVGNNPVYVAVWENQYGLPQGAVVYSGHSKNEEGKVEPRVISFSISPNGYNYTFHEYDGMSDAYLNPEETLVKTLNYAIKSSYVAGYVLNNKYDPSIQLNEDGSTIVMNEHEIGDAANSVIESDGYKSEPVIVRKQNVAPNQNIASEQQINQDKSLMLDLADVLESGEVITRSNPALDGDVRVKRGGMNEGLVHLIDHRMRERVLNKNVQMDEKQAQKETSAILFLAIDNIDKAPAIKEANGHYAVYNNGIKSVIGKDKNGRYVVTGYDNKQTEKEATESINAVIAKYGNTPEFLGIYAQVGAVIASNNIIPQPQEESRRENDGVPKSKYNALAAEYNGLLKEHDEVINDYNKLLSAYNKSQEENRNLQNQIKTQNKNKGIER